MGTYVKVASVSDIPDGTMKHFVTRGKNIAIARIGDEFFAMDDTCTHEHCSLSDEGFLDGFTVTCGCHGAQFDISTGKVLALPAPRDLRIYTVKLEGSDIVLEMD